MSQESHVLDLELKSYKKEKSQFMSQCGVLIAEGGTMQERVLCHRLGESSQRKVLPRLSMGSWNFTRWKEQPKNVSVFHGEAAGLRWPGRSRAWFKGL